jgi:hypothetical protein
VDDLALKLTDAVDEAYDNHHETQPIPGSTELRTFCNEAVFDVLQRMGSNELKDSDGKAMMADQMIDAMSRSPQTWQEIDMEAAQDFANAGRVVVAGMTSTQLAERHGHVVVCRPGLPDYSAKWQGKAPKVCHCGFHPWIGRGAEYAFPGMQRPQFWMLKEANNG